MKVQKVRITKSGKVIVGRISLGTLTGSCGPHGTSTGDFAKCPNTTPLTWALDALGINGIWGANSGRPVGTDVPRWM